MTNIDQEVQTVRIAKSETIAAPVEVVWDALLYQLGPGTELEAGKPMPMVLEAFPGGRWFRDTGEKTGNLWAHVQVIKTNKLLELCGPLFMSYAAHSHLQYKLVGDGANTRLDFVHTGFGLIPAEVAAGMQGGWGQQVKMIRERAEKRGR